MTKRNIENKPKATKAQADRYDFLHAEICRLLNHDFDSIQDELKKVNKEYQSLFCNLDWHDEVFEADGKKGLKDIKGETVVPAIYDDICIPGNYLFPHDYAIAKKGDKVALVDRDGKGTPRSAFDFSKIIPIMPTLSEFYLAFKEGDDKHFALLVSGKEFTPYELTKCYEPCNGYLIVADENDKCGMLDLERLEYVAPEYDEIYDEGDGSFIIFVKDGKEGWLTFDRRFILKDDYDKMSDEEQDELLEAGFFTTDLF